MELSFLCVPKSPLTIQEGDYYVARVINISIAGLTSCGAFARFSRLQMSTEAPLQGSYFSVTPCSGLRCSNFPFVTRCCRRYLRNAGSDLNFHAKLQGCLRGKAVRIGPLILVSEIPVSTAYFVALAMVSGLSQTGRSDGGLRGGLRVFDVPHHHLLDWE